MAFDLRNSRSLRGFGVASLAALGMFPSAAGTAQVPQVGSGQTSLAANTSGGASFARKITPNPSLTANYHIDRSEQSLHSDWRRIQIRVPNDGWSGDPITSKFTAPLGMKESELPESKNFSAQQVHSLKVVGPDGKELRFVSKDRIKDLSPSDHDFWTLENGQLTGHSVVAIRLGSPGKGSHDPVEIRYRISKTDIHEKVVDGADPAGYKTPISEKAQVVGLELAESGGYTVDAGRLVDLFQSRGMVEPDFRVSDLLVQMLRYAGTLTYNKDANADPNVNSFFENPSKATGDCHVSTQFGLGARVFGVPAFKASGMPNGSNLGHATSRFYDVQLGDFVPVDFSYAMGARGVSFGSPQQFPTVANQTYYELDASERQVAGIAGIAGDVKSRGVKFETLCGDCIVFDGKTPLGKCWPAYIEGSAKTVPLKPTDPGYVVFKTGVGPTFPNGRPKE